MSADELRWYAVHTAPQREADADRLLRQQGYLTFLPHERVTYYRNLASGRRALIRDAERPVFKRYLFAALRGCEHESIGAINDTLFVSTVVFLGGGPLQIPGAVMDELFDRFDGPQVDETVIPFPAKVGDELVLADPYDGLVVTLASIDDLDKKSEIAVFAKLLGAEREIKIPVQAVAEIIGKDDAPRTDARSPEENRPRRRSAERPRMTARSMVPCRPASAIFPAANRAGFSNVGKPMAQIVDCRRVPFGARALPSMLRSMEDKDIDPDILSDAPQLAWYALLTPPGREFVAQKILRRYGLRTYVPIKREWRRQNKFVREKELKSYAAVPRYVFAGFPMLPLWFDLFSLPVISGVVGLGGEPKRLPTRGMLRLIRHTGGGLNAPQAQKFMLTHHEFDVGQIVEVIDGPFEGRKVPVIEMRGRQAVVLMEMFRAEMEIELSMNILQAA